MILLHFNPAVTDIFRTVTFSKGGRECPPALLNFSYHLLDKGNVGDCDITITIHIGNR